MHVSRFFANSPTSDEAAAAISAEGAFRNRNRSVGMAGDLRLGVFFSLLLPARRGAALRRCRSAHQHRPPRLRFENSRAAATRHRVASAAALADDSIHRVEAHVADWCRRLDSLDGGIRPRRTGNLPAGAKNLKPRRGSQHYREGGGVGLCGCIRRESKFDLYAVDCDGRVTVSSILYLGCCPFCRVYPPRKRNEG